MLKVNQFPLPELLPEQLFMASVAQRNLKWLDCALDEITGGGISFEQKDSELRAVGEFVERYASSCNGLPSVFCSYNDLLRDQINAVNPLRFKPYADWQYRSNWFKLYGLKKWKSDDCLKWVKGYELTSGRVIYVPAFLSYFGYHPMNESRYVNSTSTGLAAGADVESAVEGAFLELLERDSFSKFWYKQNQYDFIKYDRHTIMQAFNDVRIQTLFGNMKVKPIVFDLGRECKAECCVVFLFYQFKGRTLFSLGSACRFSKLEAIVKAAMEAYQGVNYTLFLLNKYKEWPKLYRKVLSQLNNFDRLYNFYNAYPELRKMVPILKAAQEEGFDDVLWFDQKMKRMNPQEINSNGLDDLVVVDLTTADVDSLGFKVVRLFSNRLIPLTGNFNTPFLGHSVFARKSELYLKLPHCFP